MIILFPLQINSISNDYLGLQFSEDLFEMKQTKCIFEMFLVQEFGTFLNSPLSLPTLIPPPLSTFSLY